MRTIAEIKKDITDGILADDVLRAAIGLTQGTEWDAQVSAAGVLNMMIYVVAVAQYATEWLFEQFKGDVERRIDAALPGTISWYWNKTMAFQYGDDINLSGGYDVIDESKKIIKHCSVLEVYNGIMVKVNKSSFATLTNAEKTALETYLGRVKFAGTSVSVYSLQPDDLTLGISITRNPMLLNADGTAVGGDGTNLIGAAIGGYLDGIVYGGVFNKTRLLDAVQQVPGVEDVIITSCVFTAYDAQSTTTTLTAQNYTSVCGHIKLDNLTITEIAA